MNPKKAKDCLCLALDLESLIEAERTVKLLKDHVGIFKIGKQLFTKEGPKAVEAVHKAGAEVFLDLKYHDIPNTVSKAAIEASRLGVFMFNVHASGGSEMMKVTVEAVENEVQKSGIRKPIVLAVTVLTSLNDAILKTDLKINETVEDLVVHYAKLSQFCGLSGVVASPKEIALIRQNCGDDFIILTPGIRPAFANTKDDQQRVMTPSEAIKQGANYIVIGRPILNAADPVDAANRILNEMAKEF